VPGPHCSDQEFAQAMAMIPGACHRSVTNTWMRYRACPHRAGAEWGRGSADGRFVAARRPGLPQACRM